MSGGPTAGPRVAKFVETFLSFGGSYLGRPFRLLPFQRSLLDDVYALDPATGRRLRRTYLLGLPRKNGKSQLGAAVALYHLIVDEADAAPQVISAAGDRKQARLVFDEARRMVLASPDLSEVCTVNRNTITCHRTGGTYTAVSADARLQQGLNPSFVVFDELHVFRNPELYEALTLGSATRNQPLTLVISTAGFDLDSPLGRLYRYGLTVDGHRLNGTRRRGEITDPTFGMEWWGPEPGDDPDPAEPATWQRFNPAWSIINPAEMASAWRTTHQAAFVRYRLNGWTSAESAWLPHGLWASLTAGPAVRPLAPGDEVVLGFDGAWRGDSTGLVAVRLADLHLGVVGHWEAPAHDPGWRTPVEDVAAAIRAACRRFRVVEITADPYRWEQTLSGLAADGLPVVEYPTNSLARMVPATQTFYDACRDRLLTHDSHPALARHIANAVLREDAHGGRITKEHKASRRHIDLAVAAVIGVHRASALRADREPPPEPRLLVL